MSIEAVLANAERWHVEVGDVIENCAKVKAGSVQAIITSPPYWNLRSYLPSDHPQKAQEIGSEPTPEIFIKKLVKVFRSAKRILRDDGTLFVNLGDSYAASGKGGGGGQRDQSRPERVAGHHRKAPDGFKEGDLCMVPAMFAIAMRADGWFLRSVIIWAKKSPMPESISGWRWGQCRVPTGERQPAPQGGLSSWDMGEHAHGPASGEYRGQEKTIPKYKACPGCEKCGPNGGLVLRRGKWRPTTAHEYIYLFTKGELYFCDGDAVKEACSAGTHSKGTNRHHKNGTEGIERQNGSFQNAISQPVETRNPRSVWQLGNEPENAKHFATFPSAIPRKCLKAAVSSAGCCAKCGASYAPVVSSERVATRPGDSSKVHAVKGGPGEDAGRWGMEVGNRDPQRHVAISKVTGYRPTCACVDAGPPVPSIVADIFSGSGTTGRVAYSMGLRYLGFELSEEYAAISREKIVRPFAKSKTPKHKRPMTSQKPLFE